MTAEMVAATCTGATTHSFGRAGATIFSSFAATERRCWRNSRNPKRPITLRFPVMFTKSYGNTEQQLSGAIRYFTEVAGIVPFNWEHKSSIPEAYQSNMRRPDDKLYLLWFGFDTMEDALAAKARFDAI